MMSGHSSLSKQADDQRSIGLTVILIIIAAANLFGLVFGITHREEFFIQFPRFTAELWAVYLLCPLTSLVALAALWFWRKWGLWLAYVVGVVVFSIEAYAMPFGWHLARILVSIGLLTFFVRSAWKRFV